MAAASVCCCFRRIIPACTSIAGLLRPSPVAWRFQEWHRGLAHKNRDNRRAAWEPSVALTPRPSTMSWFPNPFPTQLPSRYRLPDVPRAAALPVDRVRTLHRRRAFPELDNGAGDLAPAYSAQEGRAVLPVIKSKVERVRGTTVFTLD